MNQLSYRRRCAFWCDVKPENWSFDYALLYGGMHGEEEQVFGSGDHRGHKEIEGGAMATARKMGVSYETMLRWKTKYGGMTVSEAQEKRRLEDENRRLRQLVSQFAIEVDALKAALGKKWDDLRATGGCRVFQVARCQSAPCVHACEAASLTCRYAHRRVEPAELVARMRELASERPRFGYRRLASCACSMRLPQSTGDLMESRSTTDLSLFRKR